MLRKDLVKTVKEKHRISQQEAEDLLDTILETIQDRLACGEEVILYKFGRFQVNHKTVPTFAGQKIDCRVVSFRCSPTFKKRLNGDRVG